MYPWADPLNGRPAGFSPALSMPGSPSAHAIARTPTTAPLSRPHRAVIACIVSPPRSFLKVAGHRTTAHLADAANDSGCYRNVEVGQRCRRGSSHHPEGRAGPLTGYSGF